MAVFVVEAALTLSGLTVVAVPLALWIAWSEIAYYAILAVGAGGFMTFCLLAMLQQRLSPEGASRIEGGQGSVPQVQRWVRSPDLLPEGLRPKTLEPRAAEWQTRDMHDPATYRVRRSGVREGLRVLGWTFGTAGTLMAAGGVLLFMVYLLLAE